MKLIYLIGGTGNQLFQYASSNEDDMICDLLTLRLFRRLLGWTTHENILKLGSNRIIGLLALPFLVLDIAVFKIIGITLFTTLNVKKYKSKPCLFEVIQVSYEQNNASHSRDLGPLKEQFLDVSAKELVVMHIRGGDLVELERTGITSYGLLAQSYYVDALAEIEKKQKLNEVFVATDDEPYARKLLEGSNYKYQIKKLDLTDTFKTIINSKYYVSSNSTLSYWLVKLRGDMLSIVPSPFMKSIDFSFSESVLKINARWVGSDAKLREKSD